MAGESCPLLLGALGGGLRLFAKDGALARLYPSLFRRRLSYASSYLKPSRAGRGTLGGRVWAPVVRHILHCALLCCERGPRFFSSEITQRMVLQRL